MTTSSFEVSDNPAEGGNMFKLSIISDIHNGTGARETVEQVLDDVVGRFNDEFEPDYTVVLGDLIEDTGSKRIDVELIRQVKAVLDRTESPIWYMAGNHDPVALTTEELQTILGNEMYGTARIGERTLVFLDSSAPRLEDPRGEIDEPQLAWLDETLRTADAAYVFVHHPIHYCDLSDNYWFATTPEQAFCGNKVAINEVMNDHETVKAVFNGHIHETRHVTYNGIENFTINAFNKVRPETSVTGTHAEVTIEDGSMNVRLFERCDPVAEFAVTL